MLISIKRKYLSTGLEVEVLLNTDYMVKVEATTNENALSNPDDPEDRIQKPRTRIIMDGFNEPNFIYTNETLAVIKTKLSKLRKTR